MLVVVAVAIIAFTGWLSAAMRHTEREWIKAEIRKAIEEGIDIAVDELVTQDDLGIPNPWPSNPKHAAQDERRKQGERMSGEEGHQRNAVTTGAGGSFQNGIEKTTHCVSGAWKKGRSNRVQKCITWRS